MPARIGVIADVHGDLEALVAALKKLEELEELGCHQNFCAGDLVGYGVFTQADNHALHGLN